MAALSSLPALFLLVGVFRHPIHKVVVGGVFCAMRSVRHEIHHVARMIPPLGRPEDLRIIPNDEWNFLFPIYLCFLHLRLIVKHADALMNLGPGCRVVRRPVLHNVRHWPSVRIPIRRIERTVGDRVGQLIWLDRFVLIHPQLPLHSLLGPLRIQRQQLVDLLSQIIVPFRLIADPLHRICTWWRIRLATSPERQIGQPRGGRVDSIHKPAPLFLVLPVIILLVGTIFGSIVLAKIVVTINTGRSRVMLLMLERQLQIVQHFMVVAGAASRKERPVHGHGAEQEQEETDQHHPHDGVGVNRPTAAGGPSAAATAAAGSISME